MFGKQRMFEHIVYTMRSLLIETSNIINKKFINIDKLCLKIKPGAELFKAQFWGYFSQ